MTTSRALVAAACLSMACSPDLPDVPYACGGESAACPDGFTCRATVCVRDGATPPVARPMRVSWINSGEMYWFAGRSGGATLVVNDGFTDGGRGIYELHVEPSGEVLGPKLLLALGQEFPTASAVVALDAES